MNDYLVRGMTMDGFVKMVAIRSTELVRRGCEIQKTTPNATAAFGRCLTAASMMGHMQKVENGSMTLQIRGGGPIGTITVVSTQRAMSVAVSPSPMCLWRKSFPANWTWAPP